MPFILARILNIIHYLGWAGVLIGFVLFVLGNRQQGTELMISGVVFIAAKYGAALLLTLLVRSSGRRTKPEA